MPQSIPASQLLRRLVLPIHTDFACGITAPDTNLPSQLPAKLHYARTQYRTRPLPLEYQAPVLIVPDLFPHRTMRVVALYRRKGLAEPQVVARVGADKGRVDGRYRV